MTSTETTNTSKLSRYRELIRDLNGVRRWCGSHDLKEIQRVIDHAFSHADGELGWRAAMRFIGENWTWFEINTFVAPILRPIMAAEASHIERARRRFMSKQERDAFDRLPDEVTIYRGGGRDTVLKGQSWSLSPQVAERFALYACSLRRHMFRLGQKNPVVVEATVAKDCCFAVKLDRDEEEVIVLPGPHVRVARIRAIKQSAAA